MKKILIIVIVVILILVVLVFANFAIKAQMTVSSSGGQLVRVENAQRGELIEYVSAPGEIEPKTKVAISAKVSARIIELPYEEGDTVTKGNPNANPPVPASVLVRLDDKDLQSQLNFAKASKAAQAVRMDADKKSIESQSANLIGLEARLENAKKELERQTNLLASEDIPQKIYEQALVSVSDLQAQYDSSTHTLEAQKLRLLATERDLEAAQERVNEAEEALTYTTITSPIDGVVIRVNKEVGETAIVGTIGNPGTVIVEVADLSKMLVVAQVSETDVGKLKVGQKAVVQVNAYPDMDFDGTVSSIALSHNTSSSGAKYFRTEILLKPTEQQIFSGLTAHVDIETFKYSDVIKVPSQAVLSRDIDSLPLEIRDNSEILDKDKTFATVVYRYIDGKAVVTPVKMGISDLTDTIIEEGLTEEDKVVIGPYKILDTIKHNQNIKDEREAKEQKKQTQSEIDANSN